MNKKLIVFFGILLIILIVSGLLTSEIAGYNYTKGTATKLEIIPDHTNFEDRIIIDDREHINNLLTEFKNLTLVPGYYGCFENIRKDEEIQIIQVIVQRYLAENDLSWGVCTDGEYAYIKPFLSERNRNVEFKTSLDIIEYLDEIIEER